jgi:hypothetical protein
MRTIWGRRTRATDPHSPATFAFELRDDTHREHRHRFELDAFRLPPREPCHVQQDTPGDQASTTRATTTRATVGTRSTTTMASKLANRGGVDRRSADRRGNRREIQPLLDGCGGDDCDQPTVIK